MVYIEVIIHVLWCVFVTSNSLVFLQLTHNIFDFVLNLWNNQMSRFDEYLTQNKLQNAHMMLEYAHLTLKG